MKDLIIKFRTSDMYTSTLYLKIISQLTLEQKVFRSIKKERILPENFY